VRKRIGENVRKISSDVIDLDWRKIQSRIGYQFHQIQLLKQGLTHSSYANEKGINKLKKQ
jgi:dsRNA-specific ribonuclease